MIVDRYIDKEHIGMVCFDEGFGGKISVEFWRAQNPFSIQLLIALI